MDEGMATKSIRFTDPLSLIYLDSLKHPVLRPVHQSLTQLQTLVIKQLFSVNFCDYKIQLILKDALLFCFVSILYSFSKLISFHEDL